MSSARKKHPDNREQGDEGDEDLRADAVEAPDFEDVRLNVGEIEGETEADDGSAERDGAAAEEGEESDGGIAGDSDSGDGYVADHGVAAMVDDAAVPVGVDVAGFDGVGIVDLQGEAGDDDATDGEESDDIAHESAGPPRSRGRKIG